MKTFVQNDTRPVKEVLRKLFAGSRSILLLFWLSIFCLGSKAQTTVTLTGTGTFTVPVGVSSITVECWGAGGAGGSRTTNGVGGGGGGGAYSSKVIAVAPGDPFSYSQGVASGDDSWFGSTTNVMAKGGGNVASNSATGGTGGAAALGFGTTKFSGGNGRNGNTTGTDYGGGGGSSAGTASNGVNATNQNGATAPLGGGDGGDGRFSTQGNGIDGNAPGGGGGGALRTTSGTRTGGGGGAGQIKVTYTQLTYKSQILSINTGAGPWCPGETRNVTVTIKNIGTATWTDANPDINVGVKWNTNGASWADYYVRTNTGTVAPGATQTYTIPVTASNNLGAGYTTTLNPGTNNLTFDLVYEGVSWFANNGGGVGPGNIVFTSPAITISSIPTLVSASANPNPVCEGGTLNLTGSASGASSWSWTGPNGFTSSLQNPSITNMSNAEAGVYSLTATNACGSASVVNTANVLVNPRPAVSAGTSVCVGSTMNLSPASGGTWTSSNNAIATVTNAGVVTGVSAGTASFTFTQSATGCSNSTTSVIVNGRPTAVITSSNTSICNNGGSATITGTVNATGNWTLTLSNGATATGMGNGTFSIVVNPVITTAYSIAALADVNCNSVPADLTGSTLVTVNEPVNITDQPLSQTICSSFPVSFSVNASGTGLTYQWYFGATALSDNINISGSNTATLTINQASLADAGAYHVVINGLAPCSAVVSDDAVLTVNEDIVISAQPVASIQCNGGTATFTVLATGTDISYQWRKGLVPLFDGGRISGATTATLTITNVVPGDAAPNYNVVISGAGGVCPQTISVDAGLVVNPIPDANASPVSQVVCSGNNITSIAFNGAVPSTTFNWTRDNPAVTGTIGNSGSGNISGTLINSSINPVTVTFTVTPTANGCPGSSISTSVLVNPTPDVVPTPASQSICSGASITTIALSSAVTGTTFSWTRNNPAVTGTIGNSGTGNISGTLINSTANPVLVTFTITPVANGCPGIPVQATVLVNPLPATTTTPASQQVCNGGNITTIVLSSATSGATFDWVRNNPAITGTIGNSGSGNISGTLINGSVNPVTVTFTVTANANGCPGNPATATVLVNPTPDVTATPSSQTRCSDAAISTIVLSGNTPGTVFSWTRDNTLQVTGIAASGNGNISGTLHNNSSTAITVTFTITPLINGCPGAPVQATVLVEPTPSVLSLPASQGVCYGNNITQITLSNPNNVAGTSINWTRDNPAGLTTAIPLSGSGNINGVMTNTTASPITVTFTVTASAPNACSSATTSTVVLYPQQVAPIVSSSQVICNGATPTPLTATAATGGNGTYTYQWQQGTSASGPWTNVGTGTLTYTPPSQAGFYRLVATNACGSVISNVIQISVGGDTGFTFSGTGAPGGPLCPGASFTYSISSSSILGLFGGNYIRYTWSANTTYINSATTNPYGTTQTVLIIFTVFNGTATFTVQNPTAAPVTTNLTITPVVYNSSGVPVCNLTPSIIPVTINPTPSVNNVASQVVCNNTATSAVNFSGLVSGTTYTWTNNNTTIGLAANGSGNIPSFTATNSGTTPVTATITVTPNYGSCPGASKTFTITVNPSPTVNTIANQVLCNNASTAAVNFSGAVGGTIYSWTNNNTSIGLGASGTGNIPSFTATNSGTTPVTATITVTPSYTNASTTCAGASKTFTITVNPNVFGGTVTGTSPLCINATATYSSNGTPGGTWSSSNTAVATVNPSTGLVTAVAQGTANIIYTVNTGCNAPASAFATVTVNPNANAGTVSGASPLCIGATATYSSNGDVGGTWSSSNTAVATVNPSTGIVTAVGPGSANIIYTLTGCNAVPSSKTVVVSPNATAGVISGTSPLCISATATYTSNGDVGGTWSSGNTAIATVNPSTGLVTAVAPGTVNIIYTVGTGCNSPVLNFKTLTVSPNANAGTVSGPSPVCIGSGTFYFSNGDPGGTWSSSNTAVATVNPSTGFVTPVAQGTANIIYTINTGCNTPITSFKTITVSSPAPATPGSISGQASVCAATGGFVYSISSVTNATTYTWVVPAGWTINSGQGTTSITVTSGNAGGNITVTAGNFCGNSPVRSLAVSVTATGTWLGVVSPIWTNPANWCGGVPTASTNVVIPAGTPHSPRIPANASANNITIAGGASLTIDDGYLKVYGTITATNNLFADDGTVEFAGNTFQTIAANTFNNNEVEYLVINNSNGVGLAGKLDVYGSVTYGSAGTVFNTNDLLTLKSNNSNTAWLGNMTGKTITGNVTVERYIPNHPKAWQFLAVPVSGNQTINEAWQDTASFANQNRYPGYGTMITGNVPGATSVGFDAYTPAGASIKVYDAANDNYISVPDTKNTLISNPKGYMVFVRGDRSVTAANQAATATTLRAKGKLYTPADAPPVTLVPAGKFQSVGNPYASAIDFSQVSKSGGVQTDFFYLWDPLLTSSGNSVFGLGGFQTFSWNGSGYDVTPGGGSYSGSNRFIESGQAFFVRAPFSSGSVSFSENCKTDGSNMVYRNGNGRNNNIKQLRTNLYIRSNSGRVLVDGNLVQYDPAYSNSVDEFDALKLNNTSENFTIISAAQKLAVERRKAIQAGDTIFFRLGQVRLQQYEMEFIPANIAEPGMLAFLEDNYLHSSTVVSLHDTTRIMFQVINDPGAYAADRFRLVFRQLMPTPVSFVSISATRKADKSIAVNWAVENEMNLQQYTVERSEDGRNFTGIITVDPLLNNGGGSTYARNDISPLAKDNFYRIKAISIGGRVQYSAVVKVNQLKTAGGIGIYPNPVTSKRLQLSFTEQPAGRYSISIISSNGTVTHLKDTRLEQRNQVVVVQLPASLASGIYHISISGPEAVEKILEVNIAE
ncbi:MAG: PKD-like domain-containing protein [Ferruginibacter sp.]